MSIVSNVLVSNEPNGSRFDVMYKFVDHLGVEIFVTKKVVAGFDADADMFAMIPEIEVQQAELEVINAVGGAESGVSPDIVPDYQLQADYDRRALGQFMTLADVHHFNEGRVLFLAMESRGGANANDRADYLSITRSTYDEINSRFSEFAGVQDFLNDVKNQRWDGIPDEMM